MTGGSALKPSDSAISRLLGWLRHGGKHLLILAGGVPRVRAPRISYGLWRMPAPGEFVSGGLVKFAWLQRELPHFPTCFNILYLSSSKLPQDWSDIVRLAQRKRAKLVWNQDGVAFPAWAGPGWESINRPMAEILHRADHVFYQSGFCKNSADVFLGARNRGTEILYNPVDVDCFSPRAFELPYRPLILLAAGTVRSRKRFASAVGTLAALAKRGVDARLIFAGRLEWDPDERVVKREASDILLKSGVADRIQPPASYLRSEAPSIFRSAHILLHTKVHDPCPTVVLEAMASGLPVAHMDSGGVPELVGKEAGVAVHDPSNWEVEVEPDSLSLADAVAQIADSYDDYSRAARARAVERFGLDRWIARHREVFQELLG